ncbi:hypothetical protein DAETH_08140 [Deinococcus aetherius]|uniref:Uncharacterized protein n=1 Tax=Deinococcus aetherius TaxID=200252 RepID=A0ABM8AAQ8_9DEIO|nr:hypothetical protein DAETH_08140 [Deinococcus aetherius]
MVEQQAGTHPEGVREGPQAEVREAVLQHVGGGSPQKIGFGLWIRRSPHMLLSRYGNKCGGYGG